MKTINVKYTNKDVEIVIENNLFRRLNDFLDLNKKYFIITDEVVYKLYLQNNNFNNVHFKIIASGENQKNITTIIEIISTMLEANINKGDIILNIGGGVISDIGGFVASIYKRGIMYYNIPTTLLAQVDASIGGKTAIDFSVAGSLYKNQVGTIYHPTKVLVDPTFLKTLPDSEYSSGIGEVIKYGLCFDKDLFNSLFNDFEIEEIIYKCLKIKASITEQDELDQNIRLALNYGHTVGHAIEAMSKFTIPHGICVIYGMLLETKDASIKALIIKLCEKFNIKLDFAIRLEDLKNYIIQDKKIEKDYLKLPILEKIGKVVIKEIKIEEFLERLK